MPGLVSYHLSGGDGHIGMFGYEMAVTQWTATRIKENADVTQTNSQSHRARLPILHDWRAEADFVWDLDQIPEALSKAMYNASRRCGGGMLESIVLKIGCRGEYRSGRAVLDEIVVTNAAADAVRGKISFSCSVYPLTLYVDGVEVSDTL
jgi:hypothetical protein